MFIPFSITSTIAITFLGIMIPFFVFAVTLLGNAIERAKEEERKDFDIKINDIENRIKAAKETGNITELEK